VLRVIDGVDFKTTYADSLRNVYPIAKPLGYFGVLWVVFAHLLRAAKQSEDFAEQSWGT
jgi:hypothetical protein